MEIWSEIKESFLKGSVVTRLIYLNLAVFVIFRLAGVLFFLSGETFTLVRWFELPAGIQQLLRQPWSLVTYMFLHFDFLHLLFNVLMLYWFGQIFLDYFSQRQLLGLYLLGGLAGGLLYVALYNWLPPFRELADISYLLGASAAVIAIIMASAFYAPNRRIHLFLIGSVPLKYLALFMVLSYIIGISAANAGGNIAHLGGVAAGFAFVAALRRGSDIALPFARPIESVGSWFKPRRNLRVVHRGIPRNDREYNQQRAADHQELNRILDKIAENGYASLTAAERETLFRHGK